MTKLTLTTDQMNLATRIRAMVSTALSGAANDMADASEALKNAADVVKNSGRLTLARDIANLSHTEAWKGNDIAAACEYARTMGNGNDKTAKTLNTAISEMRLFANPNVRAHVPTLADACIQAWDEEAMEVACADPEDRKSVPTPVRNYASRVYHLVCNITRAVKDNKLTVYNSADVVWWAKVNDPDMVPANALKKIQSVMKSIDAIRNVYSVADLDAASDVLRGIDEKMLEAGLTRPVHVKPGHSAPATHTPATHTPAPAAPVEPAPAPAPVPVPVPEPVVTPVVTAVTLLEEPNASQAPAEGVFDYGHDAFDNLVGLAA